MPNFRYQQLLARIALIIALVIFIPLLFLAYFRHAAHRFYNTLNPIAGELVLHSDRTGQYEIYTLSFHTGTGRRDLTQLTHLTGESRNPMWSPDGTMIVFQSRHELASTESGYPQYWHIYVMDTDGSNPRAVTAGLNPVWMPDNRHIAFTNWYGTYVDETLRSSKMGQLYVVDIDTNEVTTLTQDAPESYRTRYGSDVLFTLPLNPPGGMTYVMTMYPELAQWQIDQRELVLSMLWLGYGLIAPNGRYLAHLGSPTYPVAYPGALYITEVGQMEWDILWQFHGERFTWSPDSRYVAYDAFHPDGKMVIAVYAIDGSNLQPLLGNDGFNYGNPSWKPN